MGFRLRPMNGGDLSEVPWYTATRVQTFYPLRDSTTSQLALMCSNSLL